MKFSKLAEYFEEIEKTTSRLIITRLLSDLFKKLSPPEIEKTIYLMMGRVAPIYEESELGMAEKMVEKSVVSALNLERKYFEKEYKSRGDFGAAVEHFKKLYQSFDKKDLTILEVYQKLYDLAHKSGARSQEMKVSILAVLISQLDPLSCRYLVRIPLGIMRLGFSDMTVLDALSWLAGGDKTLRKIIEKAYHVRPDLGFISRLIKEHGVKGLKKIKPEIYTPILMMRAERLSSGREIIEKIGRCSIESKYDGFRLQIHFRKGGEVRLYSRSLEDVSRMYPDIIAGVKEQIIASEVIFEGEAIGFNPNSQEFLPFQETVQRKRKYDIAEKAREIPLKLFAFELLFYNGDSYIERPFSARRKKLQQLLKTSKNISQDTIILAADTIVDNAKKIELMFDEALSKGLEGIIAKKLDGTYQAGARGWNWIKFKKSYSSKIEDTIDCLVMGYDFGKGKRTSFGMGAFLAGVLDEASGKFVTVAKIGTGLTDEEWKQLKIKSQKLKIKEKPKNYNVDKMTECDVWVTPAIVVEIKADEITRSPVHTAGYALRFPRLQHFRDDKRPEDTTTLTEFKKMFKAQKI